MTGRLVPFTRVDELGCYFDDPAEPNNIHMEARLAGHLDPARLHAAVLAALDAHPLARARRAGWHGWQRRFHWEIADVPDVPPLDHVRWRDEDELAAHRLRLLAAAPPLDTSPPLRIRHAVGPNHDVLILNAHHAALDGLSCLRLLRSVARRYAGRPDPVGSPPPSSPTRSPPTTADPPPLRPAARIAADRAEPGPGCGFHLLSLPCRPIHNGQCTVNDLLLAALCIAVGEWNTTHGTTTGPIRITMPVDIRPASAESGEPLGNLSRLAVITTEPARRRPDLLLVDITRQTRAAKRAGGSQVDAVSRLLATPVLPVAVKARLLAAARLVAGATSGDTSILSNLGIVTDPPDFGPRHPVTGLWFAAPARMPRGLSVGTLTVRGRLHVCLRYRRTLFDASAATRFAATFRAALYSFGDPRFDPP